MSKKRFDHRQLTQAALLFAALGDPTRLALLKHLSHHGPASVSTLAEQFPAVTRQAVSKHLHVLSSAGVIDGTYRGREHVWTVNPDRLEDGRRHIDLIAREWDDALARFKAYVEGVD
jgi:DNA-binding transcriptional ArsR family regulator